MSNKLKVLNVVGTMNIGGAETMLMNILREIDKNKIQFDFLEYVSEKTYYDDEIIKLGSRIIRVKPVKDIGVLKNIIELRNIIKREKYDIVHAHTLFNCGLVMIAAKLAGVKIRISHSHTNNEINFGAIRRLYYFFMKTTIKLFSTKFIGVSKEAGEYLFGSSVINSTKYEFLPNFIEYEKIIRNNYREVNRKILNIDKDDIVLGNIGRFIPLKNHKLILEIAKELKHKNQKIKVLLVGDGQEKENLKLLTRQYDLEKEVIFTGYRKDTDNLLKVIDVFIMPSLFEGFGMAAVESQVAGIPTIVSDVIPDEVDLDIGLLKKISLDQSIDRWCDEIINNMYIKEFDNKKIRKALKNKCFLKEDIINKIYEIYKVDRSKGFYEEYISSQL